ncbi:4-galactosyl-N-acetylglucosaminide 3-alpha-L-fucosyltransferase 9 [Osmia lignaria lignaria]|uniref:4-galactosyl-N-acetylglucosaminide 3-alpha-L-fucosyltransferase 9 n=1 Tax=Osmia lignaria lignaria TaxID=1437193 RepID=UPI001478D59F|nr:4-galactosyl-N-acetylglucosaminide 3-alpha-L-fucosyltransferase 9-like [Osmia lignaria]XP_034193426.1 4-galactosyl-N-acetylglucosaminide 3-alpha-L-fucosyltransferase 9-like [Osmia lignaria]
MFRISRYIRILLFIFLGSTIFCAVFITFPNFVGGKINRKTGQTERQKQTHKIYATLSKKYNLTKGQISNTSVLGKWLLSPEGSLPPPIINTKKEPYLILIWKHGKFLERRHIKRFTNNKFSPWDGCTVNKCVLSYQMKDIDTADAVVFHLHLTKGISELPFRTRQNQRWIFLADESPIHTFLYGNQQISEYNGLFNWSMTYRMDSDIPVPYGRTVLKSFINSSDTGFSEDFIRKLKTKLVTVMGSNCAGTNGRWKYVNELKSILGNDLHIYGKCLNGNTTACPGHFDKDCSALNAYKFYLAFENSNCKEYITEKVFWHGYRKLAIPIIMGAPKENCEQLLPPHSFLHISDFVNPTALANYIRYLNQHDDKYLEYHKWRKYYKVNNEHGYFGSISRHYCRICEALHYNVPAIKIYEDMESFWNKKRDCTI